MESFAFPNKNKMKLKMNKFMSTLQCVNFVPNSILKLRHHTNELENDTFQEHIRQERGINLKGIPVSPPCLKV